MPRNNGIALGIALSLNAFWSSNTFGQNAGSDSMPRQHPLPVFYAEDFGRFVPDRVDHAPVIQRAIDAASKAGGGTVKVPPQRIWVAVNQHGTGITLRKNVQLDLGGSTLELLENSLANYNIILLQGEGPTAVLGGEIVGDALRHSGRHGEWGMCVGIRGASKATIAGTKIRDCWGDGIYVGSGIEQKSRGSDQIRIRDVEVSGNRRNNISLVHVRGFHLTDVTTHSARGTLPESGIDIEPNSGDHVIDGKIENVVTYANNKRGFMIDGGRGVVRNISIRNLLSHSNRGAGVWLQAAQDVRLESVRSRQNGCEGLAALQSTDIVVDRYEGLMNGHECDIAGDVRLRESNAITMRAVQITREGSGRAMLELSRSTSILVEASASSQPITYVKDLRSSIKLTSKISRLRRR